MSCRRARRRLAAASQDILERSRCNNNAPGLASQVSMRIEIREYRFPVPLLEFPVRVRREFVCSFADPLWNLCWIGLCDGRNRRDSLYLPCKSGNGRRDGFAVASPHRHSVLLFRDSLETAEPRSRKRRDSVGFWAIGFLRRERETAGLFGCWQRSTSTRAGGDLLHADGGKGLDRVLAVGVQHDPAAQLARISASGSRGQAANAARFRFAPAGGFCGTSKEAGTTTGARHTTGGAQLARRQTT